MSQTAVEAGERANEREDSNGLTEQTKFEHTRFERFLQITGPMGGTVCC